MANNGSHRQTAHAAVDSLFDQIEKCHGTGEYAIRIDAAGGHVMRIHRDTTELVGGDKARGPIANGESRGITRSI